MVDSKQISKSNIASKSISIKNMTICIVFCILSLFSIPSQPTIFEICNNYSFTIWAAAVPGGGGRQFDANEIWIFDASNITTAARIWARTNCKFNGSGHGQYETGDCDDLLNCQAYGDPPNTLAEYALYQNNDVDFFDISLVDGFNVAMDFSPTSKSCRGVKCAADIIGQCPDVLKTLGGCNNSCTVFKTAQYCCYSGSCGPTDYSKFFKERCPDAYSYPTDDQTSTFTCPSRTTNYSVIFCPNNIGNHKKIDDGKMQFNLGMLPFGDPQGVWVVSCT